MARRLAISFVLFVAVGLASSIADAQPYRLRADAFSQAESPIGLISLTGQGRITPWASAEAQVWAGKDQFDTEADVLSAVLKLRSPEGWGEARFGRMIATAGALRPVHTDGAYFLGRLPSTLTTLEVYGGSPVKPQHMDRKFDWLIGTRIAQHIRGVGTLGVGHLFRRDNRTSTDQEVGFDLSLVIVDDVDFVGRAAYDLLNPGFSEATGQIAARLGALRLEAYGIHRSASRILPATSLFSLLSDADSESVGGRVRWRAAPRLDLSARGGIRMSLDGTGEDLSARALLRTDARGNGFWGVEISRVGVPDSKWSGIRAFGRVPILDNLAASTELELVLPDEDSRGALWPWGLIALAWRATENWDLSIAMEGRSSAEHKSAVDGLIRVSYLWGFEP